MSLALIVDASVAAKWFVRGNLHHRALDLLDHRDRLATPGLIVSELTNIAWKKCVKGEIPPAQTRAMATAIRHYIPTLHPVSDFGERALEIALELNHPVYDCLYLACTEGGSTLITADKRFHGSVTNTGFEPVVKYFGEFIIS